MPASQPSSPSCRVTAPAAPPSLLIAGALAEVVEDQLRRLLDGMGIGPVHFLPPRNALDLPPVGPNTRLLLAQPFLADTARALEARGATRIAAPFPLGIEGTTAWLRAAAEAWNVPAARFDSVTGPARERAAHALDRYRPLLAGKSVFLFPDSQLEIPLARFLAREMGMRVGRGWHPVPAPPAYGARTRPAPVRHRPERRAGC